MKKTIIIAFLVFIFLPSAAVHADQPANSGNNPLFESALQVWHGISNFWHWSFFGNSQPVSAPVSITPAGPYISNNNHTPTANKNNTKNNRHITLSNGGSKNGKQPSVLGTSTVSTALALFNSNVPAVEAFYRRKRNRAPVFTEHSIVNQSQLSSSAIPPVTPPGSSSPPPPTPPPPNDPPAPPADNSSASSTTDTSTSTPPVIPPVITPPPPPPPVSPVVTSANLILNPSVELQTNGVPNNWYTDIEGNTTATFTYPVPGHNGGNAVQTTVTVSDPNGGDAKWLWEPIPVDANADYIFSEYYKSNVKSVVIVDFNMADGTRQFTNLIVLPPAADWTEVSKEFNVRPGTASVTVFDVLRVAGTLAVDDVSLNKLADGTFSGGGIVSLSFDDGTSSFYQNALPELLSHNFLASENIVNDWIGQPGYMTASQISEINKDGIQIGSHSLTHPYLTSLSDSDLQNEVSGSKSTFLSLGFTPISTFIYPYGDFDGRVENVVMSAGYYGARATDLGFNTRNSDPYALRTENVESNTTLAQVKTWIDEAAQNKTWLILAFHDVSDTPVDIYTITPAILQGILDYLTQTNAHVATTEYVLNNLMH